MDEAARGVEPRTFQAFQLVVLDGWAPKRAAEFLDMSVDSVYQAKARVLRQIREALESISED
jgi:DNA-directed RNA polymerase specialized sigma24 family protein